MELVPSFAGLVLFSAAAAAQAPCGAPGVDLAVEFGSPLNRVAVGGVDALAFSFQPVNLGSTPASWSTTSADHPVIGLALARFRVVNGASRMEQIGMSWARHVTIPALQTGNFCSCAPSAGATLGPGCNDTLSAPGNALAANLGPRHEVTPHSGTHLHPHTPASSGPFPGQLQFAPSDVTNAAGERYVAEAHVVAQDDATNAATSNNTTWLELAPAATGADATFALVGASHRGATVLDAWKELDPAVQIVEWDSQGEGRVQVAWCVTQTAPSTWHYEYAVYNRDYSPGIGRFLLTVPPSAPPRDIEFHDVAYHGADGLGGVTQSGVDWSSSIVVDPLQDADTLQWMTPHVTQAPNANALRWGTAYAFRFDCDRPPMPGFVLVEAFEPTTGSSSATLIAEIPLNTDTLIGSYCYGDGQGLPCPCGNHSPHGHGEGCTNSLGTGGHVRADGWSSLALETLTLRGTQMPNSTALYLQGTVPAGMGLGTLLGDGLLCIGGSLVRLGTKTNVAGASQFPDAGDPPLSVRGAVVPMTTYRYQIWYRNAAAFCTSATFNLSNAVNVTWVP